MSDTTDSTRPEEAEVRPESAATAAEGSTETKTETSTSIENTADTSSTEEEPAPLSAAAETPDLEEAPPETQTPAEPSAEAEAPIQAAPPETKSDEAPAAEAEPPADVPSDQSVPEEAAAVQESPAEDAPPEVEASPSAEMPEEPTADAAESTPSEKSSESDQVEAAVEAQTDEPVSQEAVTAEEPKAEEPPAATEATAATETAAGSDAEVAESATPAEGESTEKAEAATETAGGEDAAAQEAAEEPPVDPALLSPRQRRILELKTTMDEKTPVEGTVIGWNQGGFHISIDGVGAFVPSSLMELGPTKDPAIYIDQTFLFRVIKHQKQGRRIVLSRVPVLRELRRKQLSELRGKLEVGAKLSGKVSSLTGFGAFVDLGGLEGLVHVSELSHQRVGNPAEVLQVGQEVEVKVLKIEKKGKRISLSMKALEPDPWSEVAERYGAGKKFSGKILRHTDFGIFIELEAGIEGLLHTSQLRPGMKLDDPALAAGSEIEGWIRVCEPKRQRLSLSLREVAEGDPWIGLEDRYPDGKLVQGKVEQIAPFGAFIQLEPGLTGLLPQSEMRIPKGADPRRQYAPGQDIMVQVVDIDRGRRRLSLALEGARVEGSKADIEAFRKSQKKSASPDGGGLNALAAAFEKARSK